MRAIFLTIFLILGLIPSANAADKWIKAESPNFIVYSNSNEKITRAYLTQIERFRYVLKMFHGKQATVDAPLAKITLYFVDNQSEIQAIRPNSSSGIYGYYSINCETGNRIVLLYDEKVSSTQIATNLPEDYIQEFMFKQYAYIYLYSETETSFPPWYVAGYTKYYSSARITDTQLFLGQESTATNDQLLGKWVNWRDIISENELKETELNSFDGQSWLLVHYIYSTPERTKKFAQYLAARNQGLAPVEAFEKAFGIKISDLDEVMKKYWRSSSELLATVYKVSDFPKPTIDITPLSDTENQFFSWEAGLNLCLEDTAYKTLYKKIAAKAPLYPNDPYVQSLLAWAEIRQGNPASAIASLENLIALYPNDPKNYFRLGMAYYEMVEQKKLKEGMDEAAHLKVARSMFIKAYKLSPHSPENLYFLSVVSAKMQPEPDLNTANAALQAFNLAPSNDTYALQSAKMFVLTNDNDSAKTILLPITTSPYQGPNKRRAKMIVEAIEAEKDKSYIVDIFEGKMDKEEAK